MIRLGMTLLGFGLFLVSSGLAGISVKDELKKFQGTWKIVQMEQSGKAMTKEALAKGQVSFKGDEMSMKGLKDLADATATFPFAFDAAKKTFDLTTVIFNDDNKPEKLTLPGLYALRETDSESA